MPSPGEDYQSWLVNAVNNGNADPLINWVEFQTRASVNNSSRSELAAHAKNRNLLNGSIVTTGAPNAQAFISGVGYTSIPTGLQVKLKIGSGLTNTSSTTLNMDGIGDVLIKTAFDDRVLLGRELIAGSYADLMYNGTNWIFLYSHAFLMDRLFGGGGIVIGTQVFKTSGTATYTPTIGTECVIVECIGGGGGAGIKAGATQFYTGAGGGGGGGYSRILLSATAIGGTQTVTVGSGGTGAIAAGTAGIDGGPSSFGTLCVANGGKGGDDYIAGAGGSTVGAVGNCLAAGSPGGCGTSISGSGGYTAPQGFGGSSVLGGGAAAPNDNDGTAGSYVGINASNYGGGGSAGFDSRAGGTPVGGNGSPGVVIVTEFAARGGPGRDGEQGPIGPVGPSGPGTGDVLRSGIPTAGQMARWTDASHIEGVDAGAIGGATNGRFQFVSATACAFVPYNGANIIINGSGYTIPSAGIAGLANTGVYVNGVAAQNLAADTTYYVYAFNNAGTITGDFSTADHATSTTPANAGIEIKSGDDTRSLIGMVRTNASSEFADSGANRFVLSWFNRRAKTALSMLAAQQSTSSSALTEVDVAMRTNFLVWDGDEAIFTLNGAGTHNDATGSTHTVIAVGFDAVSGEPPQTRCNFWSQNLALRGNKTGLSEGWHYVTALFAVNGGTGYVFGGIPSATNWSLTSTNITVTTLG